MTGGSSGTIPLIRRRLRLDRYRPGVTEAELASAVDDPPPERSTASLIDRWALTRWDAGSAGFGLLLLVAFAPDLMFGSWTPRMVLVMAATPLGLVLLAALCRRRDAAAIVLAGALVWTLLCSGLSPFGRLALTGTVGRDLSALTVVGSSSFWAIGRMSSERGVQMLERVVLWGVAAGAVVGVAQVVFAVDTGPLALASGRPIGFMTNPVYFGATCAAGLAVGVALWSETSWRWVVAPLFVSGVAASLSGSRVALGAAVVVVAALAVLRRTRAVVVGALVGVTSLVAGVLLDRTVGAGRNAADRLASGAGGGRATVWRYGLEAFADRPLVGYGFGEFRPAVQGRFSSEFVRDFAAEEITQPWFDPHNAVITVLVAVGVVGFLLFFGWVLVWGRGVRGPLVWGAVPIALSWMLQPMSLHTLPLAMLLFGAAGAGTVPAVSGVRRRTAVALAALGVAAGVYLLAADISLRRATNDLDGDRAAVAASMYGRDPISGDLVAQTYGRNGATADQLEWRERVAAWEPDRPHWWSLLAQTQIGLGLLDEAEVSVGNALELQRYNVRSINTEAILAIYRDDEARLQAALDELCLVSPSECDLDAKRLLDELVPAVEP